MARRRIKWGHKQGVTRHRVQSSGSADSQDRAIERVERQATQRELDIELAEIESKESDDDTES